MHPSPDLHALLAGHADFVRSTLFLPQTGQLAGRFKPTDLGRLTTDLAEVFRSSIEKGKIGYKVDCYGDSSRLLYVDHSSESPERGLRPARSPKAPS